MVSDKCANPPPAIPEPPLTEPKATRSPAETPREKPPARDVEAPGEGQIRIASL